MKLKLFILFAGAFIATAYLIGCGNSGNNNNGSCPAGLINNGTSCISQFGVNGLVGPQSCPAGLIWAQQYGQCLQQCNGGNGYAIVPNTSQCTFVGLSNTGVPGYNGYPPPGYAPGYSTGYTSGYYSTGIPPYYTAPYYYYPYPQNGISFSMSL